MSSIFFPQSFRLLCPAASGMPSLQKGTETLIFFTTGVGRWLLVSWARDLDASKTSIKT